MIAGLSFILQLDIWNDHAQNPLDFSIILRRSLKSDLNGCGRFPAECQAEAFGVESCLDHFEVTNKILVMAFDIDPAAIRQFELPLNEKVLPAQPILLRIWVPFLEKHLVVDTHGLTPVAIAAEDHFISFEGFRTLKLPRKERFHLRAHARSPQLILDSRQLPRRTHNPRAFSHSPSMLRLVLVFALLIELIE